MIKENFSYAELVDRNWGYINNSLQKKIKKTRILFAGCGLGSVIAEIATRLGFLNFILADGDKVELSNLNRQIFNKSQIGANKAVATASCLKKINPKINVTVLNRNIENKDIQSIIKKCDFIINTVDFGEVYFNLVKVGQENKKFILLPLNIGFGGFLMIFNKDTKSINEIFGNTAINDDVIFYKTLLKTIKVNDLPVYISKNLNNIFSSIKKRGNNPQIVIGADLVGALTITSVVKILAGQKIPMAPQYIHKDVF